MIYLIINTYVNNDRKKIELRNDVHELIQIITTANSMYNIGDFVKVDIINKKYVIDCKVVKPENHLDFYIQGNYNAQYLKAEICNYVEKIEDNDIKLIVEELLENEDFYIFPAAKSIHHAHLSGIAEHVLSMLQVSDHLISHYKLDRDLMYAGIILHDYGKIRELSAMGLTYTIEGNLIGHLQIGFELICSVMQKYNIVESEKTMLLKHMIIAHHGKLEYGSAKEPMTIEAYVLSMIDEMDAKINYVETSLKNVDAGEISCSLNAFDRRRFYKTK